MSSHLQGAAYRMCGGNQNDALCVDSGFNVYQINAEKCEMEKIDGVFGFTNTPVIFHPIYDDQLIYAYLKDNMYSYHLLRLE